MTASHFNFTSGAVFRLLIFFLLTAAVIGTVWLQAQDNDSPITISDGSLTVEAAVPWSAFRSLGARSKAHPDAARSVRQVAITMPGNNQTITFSGEKCIVAIRYAFTDFNVTTGSDGKGLQVATNFEDFSINNRQLVHKTTTGKISHVTVTKGTETVFNADASGGTRIVISYR
jgi:hypothetical protein